MEPIALGAGDMLVIALNMKAELDSKYTARQQPKPVKFKGCLTQHGYTNPAIIMQGTSISILGRKVLFFGAETARLINIKTKLYINIKEKLKPIALLFNSKIEYLVSSFTNNRFHVKSRTDALLPDCTGYLVEK